MHYVDTVCASRYEAAEGYPWPADITFSQIFVKWNDVAANVLRHDLLAAMN